MIRDGLRQKKKNAGRLIRKVGRRWKGAMSDCIGEKQTMLVKKCWN